MLEINMMILTYHLLNLAQITFGSGIMSSVADPYKHNLGTVIFYREFWTALLTLLCLKGDNMYREKRNDEELNINDLCHD